MILFRIFLLTCLALSLGTAQAERSTIPWPILATDLPLWTPDHAHAGKKWPAILYYPGTNGRPTIHAMQAATRGRDYVLVGFGYLKAGRFQQDEKTIAAELSQLADMKAFLVRHHAVDPSRIYVAGFSKGGWFTATLLERDRSLAGGLVLGAGVLHARHAAAPRAFATAKPIYVGVGREDENYPQSLRALVHFRKLGAQVLLESWPEVGHAFPETTPLGLQQWLTIQAQGESVRQEAEDWIARRRREIGAMENRVDQYFAAKKLLQTPFMLTFGGPALTTLRGFLTELAKQSSDVAAEQRWEKQLQNILRRESLDRYVTTLENVHGRYTDLAANAAGSRIGEIAARDAARTAKTLKTIRQ